MQGINRAPVQHRVNYDWKSSFVPLLLLSTWQLSSRRLDFTPICRDCCLPFVFFFFFSFDAINIREKSVFDFEQSDLIRGLMGKLLCFFFSLLNAMEKKK